MITTAIETHYAGYRFRSRLEARWAVFFDHLGIKWEYEPQGYVVGKDKRPYLPDFRLPDLQAFVEVKGDADRLDLRLLADLAGSRMGRRDDMLWVLILGDVPVMEVGNVPTHSMLSFAFDYRYTFPNDGPSYEVLRRAWAAIETLDESDKAAVKELREYDARRTVVYQNFFFLSSARGTGFMPIGPLNCSISRADVLNPHSMWPILPTSRVQDAYAAARTARFEHGETPVRKERV